MLIDYVKGLRGMNRETFLKDFKGRMKSEFEDFTTSSALISFPETLAESTGVNHVSIFNVSSYLLHHCFPLLIMQQQFLM